MLYQGYQMKSITPGFIQKAKEWCSCEAARCGQPGSAPGVLFCPHRQLQVPPFHTEMLLGVSQPPEGEYWEKG